MRHLLVIFGMGLILACGSNSSSGTNAADIDTELNKGKVIAEIGSVEVKEGFIDLLKRINPNIEKQVENPMGKKKLVDSLVDQELLYKESIKRGIQNKKDVQEKMAIYGRVIIAQALIEDEVERKAKEEYEKNKDTEYNQVKIAHILISNRPEAKTDPKTKKRIQPEKEDLEKAQKAAEEKAQEISKKLANGGKWNELVEEYSDDRLSNKKGGDIGYLTKNDRRILRLDWKKIVDESFSLKKDQTSQAILAKDGYHIIKVLEEPAVKPYAEVENAIKFKLRRQAKNDVLKDLKGDKKISYLDETIKDLKEPSQQQKSPMKINPSKMPMTHPHPGGEEGHQH